MNECHFIGRFTADPELNEYGGNSKVNFSLAISEKRRDKDSGELKEEVSFLEFFAWSSGADAIAKYFVKGDLIVVHAKAVQERWEKDGQKRSAIRFRVKQFEFAPYNTPRDKSTTQEERHEVPATASVGSGDGGGDNDIPF